MRVNIYAEEMTDKVVSKSAVLEFVKKQLEEGADVTEFPGFLSCDTRPTLRVNGWKGRE